MFSNEQGQTVHRSEAIDKREKSETDSQTKRQKHTMRITNKLTERRKTGKRKKIVT